MAIARLIAPFSILSGTVTAPDSQAAASAVVAMPDKNGRTLLRNYVVPNDVGSAAQLQIRSWFSNVSEAYQTLTLDQAAAWQALARSINISGRLGLDYRLTWTALFQQVNSYRLQNGQTATLIPPALDSLPTVTLTAVRSDDGDPIQEITFTTSLASSASGFLAFRVTRDLSSTSRQARRNELRYPAAPLDCILPRSATVATYTINASRLNILVGMRIGVEILTLNADYVPVARVFVTNTPVAGT